MGAGAFTRVENHINWKSGGVVLEIGSERGEGSTAFLSNMANRHNAKFFTVDVDDTRVNHLAPWAVVVFVTTGENFLERVFPETKQKIAFAYLDNFDWTYESIRGLGWYHDQANEYIRRGMVLNNENSQAAHLKQSQLIAEHAADGCVILFDDTWPIVGGGWTGKGGTAVPWLLDNGYEIVEQSEAKALGSEVYDGYVLMRKSNGT